ncbi:MAG: SDR family oxidoreductase [Gammaproteobacteria bacterium]|jgi:NAD(P)-dependent dehydrogenase (short-subunit alcohol dehydrogenase family)
MANDKVALVSGGNRGMGLETCRRLADLGYRVLLGSRDPDAGAAAAQSLDSDRVEAVKLDVTRQGDIDALAEYIGANHGRLDVLVNNAGILIDNDDGASSSIRDADIARIERSFAVNTLGPIRLVNALLPLMEAVDDARIVNVSSGMGQLSDMGGNFPGYRLSKTALNAATRIYAAELDPARFSVNSLCPGWVRTDMGGDSADLSVEEGVDTAIWLATAEEARSSGGFYRRRRPIDW